MGGGEEDSEAYGKGGMEGVREGGKHPWTSMETGLSMTRHRRCSTSPSAERTSQAGLAGGCDSAAAEPPPSGGSGLLCSSVGAGPEALDGDEAFDVSEASGCDAACLSMSILQRGHVECASSHGRMHSQWKWWPHGSRVKSCPSSKSSMQIEHLSDEHDAHARETRADDESPQVLWRRHSEPRGHGAWWR